MGPRAEGLRGRTRGLPWEPGLGCWPDHPPAFVVIPFHEVWGRSYCRALEKLVDIVSEYPSEMEYILSPSCVSLKRCTGCCGDEDLHCLPVETTNVTMQVGTLFMLLPAPWLSPCPGTCPLEKM